MSLKSLQEKIGTTPDGAFGPGTMKKVKCIFWLYTGFCSLLKQCRCVKINEDDYNPFREKL